MTNAYNIGHRKRIKEKFKSSGIDGWHDYEVLELALSFAIPRKDTKPIAKELISRFKTLSGVLDTDIKELCKIKGISEHSAVLLKFLREAAKKYYKQPLESSEAFSSPETAAAYLLAELKGCAEECFHALYLNKKNALIASETLQKGTVDTSVVYPRKVAERALYHKATGVIISHNHPSGSLKPSREDISVTENVRQALKSIDIELIDHIIIAGNKHLSMKQEGLF